MNGSTPAVVGVVDYRAGNIQSIVNAIEHLEASAVRVSRVEQLAAATHLLLPGVGAFGHCAERLRASGLTPALAQWTLEDKRPLLGICVGMQLLADWSEELGRQQGLGWAGGAVTKLAPPEPSARVPHVGWNSARFHEPFGEFGTDDEADFYFDHSYALQAPLRARTLASCTHGQTFCAAIRSGSLVAAQFHPEKSQASGLRFLRAFLALQPQ